MSRFAVRPLARSDIPRLVHYWTSASAADLERMAVDTAKLPSADALTASFEALCAAPPDEVTSFYSVWLVDGVPIGYSSLKNIYRGERAEMHLHMWSAGDRGKGFGAVLFCLSALEFYDRFRLQEIVCEPSAANPMPNRLLRRLGFPLRGTRTGVSSELSAVCELNTYLVTREIAERYLCERAQSPRLGDGTPDR